MKPKLKVSRKDKVKRTTLSAIRNRSTKVNRKRFILSYMAILILPLTLSVFIYANTISALIEKELQNVKSDLLRPWQNSIDLQFANIDNIGKNIYSMQSVQTLIRAKENFTDLHYYFVANSRDDFRIQVLSNDLLIDFFIYIYKPNMIISSSSSYQKTFFYNNIFRYESVHLSEWEQQWIARNNSYYIPERSIVYEKIRFQALTYIMPENNIYNNQGVSATAECPKAAVLACPQVDGYTVRSLKKGSAPVECTTGGTEVPEARKK